MAIIYWILYQLLIGGLGWVVWVKNSQTHDLTHISLEGKTSSTHWIDSPKIVGLVSIFGLPKFFGPPSLWDLAGRGGLGPWAKSCPFFFFSEYKFLFLKFLNFYCRLCCYYTLLICELYVLDLCLIIICELLIYTS